jgi:hypothetical protein
MVEIRFFSNTKLDEVFACDILPNLSFCYAGYFFITIGWLFWEIEITFKKQSN